MVHLVLSSENIGANPGSVVRVENAVGESSA